MSDGGVLRTLFLVGLIAVAAGLLVERSYDFSKDRIIANEHASRLHALNSVLDPAVVDADLNPVQISASDPLLGSRAPVDVFIAIDGGRPVAAIFATIAPDGYNAPIDLLIGLSVDEQITGVRVVAHRETPGLGDGIDIEKSDWVRQFDGRSLRDPPFELWAVDKDEGAFDSLTGATVTPRAVVKAVKNTLLYFTSHKEELFAAAQRAVRTGSGQ